MNLRVFGSYSGEKPSAKIQIDTSKTDVFVAKSTRSKVTRLKSNLES